MNSRPIRCLHVVEAALGGVARHVLDLIRLSASSQEIHLAYSNRRCDELFTAGLAALRRDCPDVHVASFSISREVRPSDVMSYAALAQYARQHGPFDVIHCHSTKAGFLGRLLPVSGARVYTPHALMMLNPTLRGFRRSAVRMLERSLSWISDRVICVSECERQCAIAAGISAKRTVVISNGVDCSEFAVRRSRRAELRQQLGLTPDEVAIGYVSRLVEYKRPQALLESFSKLLALTQTPCRLLMIGSGPEEPILRRQAHEFGIASRILWCGPIDAAAIFPAFDVFAHTSAFEGFGYVFPEALASGVPVVTTPVGGAHELVIQNETGFVCDPWDSVRFADYLREVVDDAVL
ncbi:MAG: glycosyltransferase, partial [Bryobacteraceae bacterium]